LRTARPSEVPGDCRDHEGAATAEIGSRLTAHSALIGIKVLLAHCLRPEAMTNPKLPDDNTTHAAKQQRAGSSMEERLKVIEEYAQSLREVLKRLRDRLN
jgi:hypothetical protein